MGNTTSTQKKRASSGTRRGDSLTRSIFFGTSIVTEAISIDSDKSVRLTEVQSSSVTSACVEVSLPFSSEAAASNFGLPFNSQNSELDDDIRVSESDENEVDLAQLNVMQLFQAESPRQQTSLSSSDGSDLHRSSSTWQAACLPVDGESASTEEKNESRTNCEVYTVTFGGLYSFSATPSTDSDDREKSSAEAGQQSRTVADGSTPREQLSSLQGRGKERRSETVDVAATCIEDKDNEKHHKTIKTPIEVYTVSFGGLHTFTAAPSPHLVDGGDNERARQCNDPQPKHKPDETVHTPCEVHTMTFGGLYTFTASSSPDMDDSGICRDIVNLTGT